MKTIAKLALMGLLTAISVSYADEPAQPAAAPPTAASDSGEILPGRPDLHVVNDLALAPEFRSLAAGIAFRPPAGGTQIRGAVGGNQIVRFVNDKEKWQLTATRLALASRAPLVSDTEKGKNGILRQGMLETSANQLKADTGATEVLRQDFINIGNTAVGMIAVRYTVGTDTRLTQRALVQADEQLYYMIDFSTPAPREGKLEDDPQAKAAVDLFGHIVESVKVLDQSELMRDQNNRLFMSKAFYLNLNEPAMRAVLVPERWERIIQDGKDVGYRYVIEEIATGLPHKGKDGKETPSILPSGSTSGIRIGVRTRTYPQPGQQIDSENWSWVAMDHKQEEWSDVVSALNTSAADPKKKRITDSEFGVAIWRVKPVKDPQAATDGNAGIRMTDSYQLTVTVVNSNEGLSHPIEKSLPPFYLTRAVDHLLPRLIPRGEAKGFMFASYVSDQKEIIRRFFDVGKEGGFTLAGQPIHAIPVQDRIGLEGSITTHYISPEGVYLGSVNDDDKLVILPTDAATLTKMWKDANLSRPGDVETPASGK